MTKKPKPKFVKRNERKNDLEQNLNSQKIKINCFNSGEMSRIKFHSPKDKTSKHGTIKTNA